MNTLLHKKQNIGSGVTVEFDKSTKEFTVTRGRSRIVLDPNQLDNLNWFTQLVRKWMVEDKREP